MPQRCGEEKEKVIKHIRKLGEEAKISVRNIRKKARKDCGDDESIQKITDYWIEEINRLIEAKIASM